MSELKIQTKDHKYFCYDLKYYRSFKSMVLQVLHTACVTAFLQKRNTTNNYDSQIVSNETKKKMSEFIIQNRGP